MWIDTPQSGEEVKWLRDQEAGTKSKKRAEVAKQNLFLDYAERCEVESLDLKSACIVAASANDSADTTENVGSIEHRGHLVLSIPRSTPLVSIPLWIPSGKFLMLLAGMEHREED